MKEYKDAMKTPDIIAYTEKGSVIQHGKLSNRIYLMKLAPQETEFIAGKLIQLAKEHGYSKIFCKIPKKAAPLFFAEGYILEGYIPYFYNGKEDVFFVSKYLTTQRMLTVEKAPMESFYELLHMQIEKKLPQKDAEGYSFRQLHPSDVELIVEIYCNIFESYPFPIHNPAYISKTMEEDVQYFGAFKNDNLVALAACETDFEAKNAEMTDFATTKEHTGHHLALRLLGIMEKEMQQQGILSLYSIARINSIPMNKTFLKSGYKYSGTLINNTHIAGGIETMNLYYKQLF